MDHATSARAVLTGMTLLAHLGFLLPSPLAALSEVAGYPELLGGLAVVTLAHARARAALPQSPSRDLTAFSGNST